MNNSFMSKLSKVNERWVFYSLILISSLPILLFQFYPSMDGAAHLYNSNIIVKLLLDSDSIFHEFYEFNPQIVPNWIGHFFLAFFNSFLPPYLAEKIVLLSYSIFLPVSFRYMIKQFNVNISILSYLIFPFVFHFLFILGYYNFSFSFILFFFIMGLIHKYAEIKIRFRKSVLLLILFFLMSVAHIFGFVLLIVSISIYFFWKTIIHLINQPEKNIFKLVYKYLRILLLSLPGIFIVLWHLFLHQSPESMKTTGSPENIWGYLMMIRPIIAYNFSRETGPASLMFLVLFSFFIINIYIRIAESRKNTNVKWYNVFELSDFWLLIAMAMILIVAIFPNHIGGAGNVLNRFGLVFFFSVISWINLGKIPIWFYRTFIVIYIIANTILIEYYVRVMKNLNTTASEIYDAANHIEENSTVFTYNATEHWLMGHFSNYIAIEKSVFVNDNYEADMGYFPIVWKKNAKPKNQLNINTWEYFLMYGNNKNELPEDIHNILKHNYKLIYESTFIKLYKKALNHSN